MTQGLVEGAGDLERVGDGENDLPSLFSYYFASGDNGMVERLGIDVINSASF